MSNDPSPLDKDQIPGKVSDPLPLRTDQIPGKPASSALSHASLPATTTVEEQTVTAGQRRINAIWEITQSIIAIMVTATVAYTSINQIDAPVMDNAFFLIASMYYLRTNHKLTGGVFQGDVGR